MDDYQMITHLIPMWLLPLWKRIFCPRGWHAWDEVCSVTRNPKGVICRLHYLSCDACGDAEPMSHDGMPIGIDFAIEEPTLRRRLRYLFTGRLG